mmetsp:Transcript_57430/g.168149  ORF Transcript_57430/g.168149 Transcript_57430/m.168149 type:complete len:502 (+) Transcript_57430:22-1527(+)
MSSAARRHEAWRATSLPTRRPSRVCLEASSQCAAPEQLPPNRSACPEPCQAQRLLRRRRPPSLTATSPQGAPSRLTSMSSVSRQSSREENGVVDPFSGCSPLDRREAAWMPAPCEQVLRRLSSRESDSLSAKEVPASPLSPVQGKLRPRHSKRSKTLYEPDPPLSPKTSSEKSAGKRGKQRPERRLERSKTWAALSISGTPTSVTGSSVSAEDSAGRSPHVSEISSLPSRTSFPNLSWRRGQKIGNGSYGAVYKAQCKETGQIFAVKEALLAEKDENDSRFRDRLEDELDICKELRHPNIVSYLGHDYEDGRLYICLEYVPGGSLSSMLNEFGAVTEKPWRTSARGLVEGLNYLHTRSPPVVHRDIKAANVLVDLNFCVKLADFGCSKRAHVTTSFTTLGSIPWMAPEVIQQQDGYGRKADIWSLGCTLIEMATAEKPWGNNTFDNVMFALRHIGLSDATPPLPEALCEEGRDLISLCVRRKPEDRPRAVELLLHPSLEED